MKKNIFAKMKSYNFLKFSQLKCSFFINRFNLETVLFLDYWAFLFVCLFVCLFVLFCLFVFCCCRYFVVVVVGLFGINVNSYLPYCTLSLSGCVRHNSVLCNCVRLCYICNENPYTDRTKSSLCFIPSSDFIIVDKLQYSSLQFNYFSLFLPSSP